MADKKITELTAWTTPIDDDVQATVDVTAGVTKKITWTTIKAFLKTYFDGLYTLANLGGLGLHAKADTAGTADTAVTVSDEAITNAKLAHIATSIVKGRLTAGTGDVEDLSAANVRTLINVADGATANAKATATENVTGTDDAKFLTPLSNVPAFNNSMARQAIINGNFDVWQRGVTKTTPVDGAFNTVDRFRTYNSVNTPPTIVESRGTLAVGDIYGAYYYHNTNVNGAGTDNAANYYMVQQLVENGTRFLAGNGKKVTLSFWAKSDIANKKIGIELQQNYGTGGSPTALENIIGTTFTLTSTWTKYTHTFTTNTLVGKTFGTDNNDNLGVDFWYVYGSNSKARVGDANSQTFVGSGNISIAQVQLCAGDVALPFMPKSFDEEKTLCDRYCQAYIAPTGTHISNGGIGISSTRVEVLFTLRKPMRIAPALIATATDWMVGDVVNSALDATAFGAGGGGANTNTYELNVTVASGGTANRPYWLKSDGSDRTLWFDAEL